MVDAAKVAVTRQLNTQTNLLESRNGIEVLNSRPLRMGVDLSNVCNINCIFCLASKGRKRRSDPDAFRSADWLDRVGFLLPYVQRAIFSSYEAVLAPEFRHAVEKIHHWHTPFNIFTNGLALTPELARFCLERGLSTMNCSFHGALPDTYHGIMRGSDYDAVVNNLMHLKLLARKINPGFRLTLVFCAMDRNIDELGDFVDLAHSLGAAAVQVNYLLVTKKDSGLDSESVFFHQDRYDYHVTRAKLKALKLGMELKHQPTFHDWEESQAGPCYRPWEHLNISHSGQTSICCGGAGGGGNIFEKGFFAVWNSERLQEFRRRVNSDDPPEVCRRCTRDRENPRDIRTHLTYLRSMPNEERQRRLRVLMREMKAGHEIVPPGADPVRPSCSVR